MNCSCAHSPPDVPFPPSPRFDGKAYAAQLSNAPGVYRMYAADERLLYVGKAAALRKRVGSYFAAAPKSMRLTTMLAQVARMDVIITRTEAEALLLENQLIKSLAPRYNIIWRDDKSYPSILLTDAPWPRLLLHRGPRHIAGQYYGPYPNIRAARHTLKQLHGLFKLRNCDDTSFKHRSRPCLQYQIDQCSAPCVAKISAEEYTTSVQQVQLFLQGKSDQLVDELAAAMQAASQALDFEHAVRLRDTIAALRSVQHRQYVEGERADLDVLACSVQGHEAGVLLWSFRDGRNLGTRNFFSTTSAEETADAILAAFISQHYLEHRPPPEIILDRRLADADLIATALSQTTAYPVRLIWNVRGERAAYLQLAQRNAQRALQERNDKQQLQHVRQQALMQLLGVETPLRRAECIDVSHTQGEATVAACVVFDAHGAQPAQYRRYLIHHIPPGHDLAALRQVLERRFRSDTDIEKSTWPDVIVVDGGRVHVDQTCRFLAERKIVGITVLGIAKGAGRKAENDTLILANGRRLHPLNTSPALHAVQQMRDEAHRFAITGHRKQRQKARFTSKLEDIPGIGPQRRARLLQHFGGLLGLKAAGVAEIAKVHGINAALAQRIYAWLHGLPPSTAGAP